MVDMDYALRQVAERNASDIHLVCGLKPMLRISRELVPIEEIRELTEEDMNEIYDYFVRGNISKDEEYRKTKKIDDSFVLEE